MSVRIYHRKDFFTYKLARNGVVFYVGMACARWGKKARLYNHISEARCGMQSPKCDVIREMLTNGEEIGYIIDREGLTYGEGLGRERELISLYGRKNLTNRTSGGKAPYEHIPTEQQRKYYQRGRNKRYMSTQGIGHEETNEPQLVEQYYTIKGYSDDHERYAAICYMDSFVSEHSTGFDDSNNDWRILEHAKDLVERNQSGDKEEAIKLFQSLFGKRNVFVKDE